MTFWIGYVVHAKLAQHDGLQPSLIQPSLIQPSLIQPLY